MEITRNFQTTTRANKLQLSGETFNSSQIDFLSAIQHVKIHTGGEVAGSQFKGFASPEEVARLVQSALPHTLHYDNFGRAELTLQLDRDVGFTGVVERSALEASHPGVSIKSIQRTPGGTSEVVEGVRGAWFPETELDASGKFVVKTNADGQPANPKFKFEPDALIAEGVPAESTKLLTVIIQKNREGKPQVVTMFPGENAPAFPTVMERWGINTAKPDTIERRYWDSHVFLRPAGQSAK